MHGIGARHTRKAEIHEIQPFHTVHFKFWPKTQLIDQMESIPAATAATAAQPADFAPGGYDIPTLQGYAQRAAAVLRQPRCQALIPALMVDTLIHDHLSRLLPHTWRHVLQTSATVPQVGVQAVSSFRGFRVEFFCGRKEFLQSLQL